MSIEKYSTPAFIIKHYENGEDNVILKVWTREFGLVFAKSQSFKKSIKLRQHAMVNRMSNLTLVKGKEYYRLAGAKEMVCENDYSMIICQIIERFIHGEEKMNVLFDKYLDFLNYIKINKETKIGIDIFKIAILIETLNALGYLDLKKINLGDIENRTPEDIFLFIHINKKDIVDEIRKSISNTIL